jgi:hypothetical protein
MYKQNEIAHYNVANSTRILAWPRHHPLKWVHQSVKSEPPLAVPIAIARESLKEPVLRHGVRAPKAKSPSFILALVPLFATDHGWLGRLGWRRKGKAQAA